MHFKVKVFAGMRPSASVDLLAPGEAASAINTKLSGGDLHPFQAPGTPGAGLTFSGAPVLSMYRFSQLSQNELQYWFQSTVDADFVRGQVDNDTTERTYWTDGVYCKKTNATLAATVAPYPSNSYRMGIPAPATPVTVSVTGTVNSASDPVETVLYCYTYVSSWGEEGPPSPVSAYVGWRPGQTLNISAMATGPGGNYSLLSKRLYRSATSNSTTKFQLVNLAVGADIPLATTTYTDTAVTAYLGDTLITTGWIEPPDTMTGLTAMANGMMAGFVGNTLCFSEPFLPYAWPVRYQQSTDAPIVGIAAFDQSLFVGTTQGIYIFTGASPSTMTSEKLAAAQSCVSKRSIVSMLGGVFFASPDGLYRLNASGLTNLTEDLMTRVEWQAYVPSSISAYETDNKYLAFFNNGTRQAGMVFTFGTSASFCETTVYATAGYRDKMRDALYLCIGNVLLKWDSGAPMTFDWLSGVFHLPSEVNVSCAKVDSSAYPITFNLYADGVLVGASTTVANRFAFRLPSGYRSRRYQVELIGNSIIREVMVATDMRELAYNEREQALSV